jgi:hypothetical protein
VPIAKKFHQNPTKLSALDIEALALAGPASDGSGSGVATDARYASLTARERREQPRARLLPVPRAERSPRDEPATRRASVEPDPALGRGALRWCVVTVLLAGAAMAALHRGAWVDPFFPPDR